MVRKARWWARSRRGTGVWKWLRRKASEVD
jgi:hypothetical protein